MGNPVSKDCYSARFYTGRARQAMGGVNEKVQCSARGACSGSVGATDQASAARRQRGNAPPASGASRE